MSKANASAKNRRAFGGNPPPTQVTSPAPQSTNVNSSSQGSVGNGFTLQQVISVIDSRLVDLETFVKETKNQSGRKLNSSDSNNVVPMTTIPESNNNSSIQEVIDEFSNRFDMVAEEIGNLKEIVLKLQSYTMDVNKTLLEERIRVLSDLGENSTGETQLFELVSNNQTENIQISTSGDLQNLVKEEFAANP